jgi:hypothetical protein
MAKFLVAHTLDHKELADHIAALGGLKNATVTVLPDGEQPTPASRNPVMAPKPKLASVGGTGKPRGRKSSGSTVNTTVLAAMEFGPASILALKQALADAGKAPGSLSTALAALQKSGAIERAGPGQYQLAPAQSIPNAAE